MIAASLLAVMPAAAEDWKTNLTVYLLAPWADLGVKADNGANVEASADPSDILGALDFGFMFAGDTHKGKVSLLYDVFYSNLGTSGNLSGPLASEVNAEMKMLLASMAVGYDIQRTEQSFAQVFGGFRYVSLKTSVDLTGGGPIGVAAGVEVDEDYFEPLIGIRGRTRLNDRLSLGGFVNVGGFGVGSEFTVDSYAGLDWALSDRMGANLGVRYLRIDYEADGADIDMEMYGPVMGLTWRF